jgi:hypothetical protein
MLRSIAMPTITCAVLVSFLTCLAMSEAWGQDPQPAQERPAVESGEPQKPSPGMMGRKEGTQGMQSGQMTCCPPSAMSKMADKPAGMVMMMACGALVAGFLASLIAVLISLSVFLIRRSRILPAG